MTKRWLSLVLVLTLLSTLFSGVAFADAAPLTFISASTNAKPITLTAGQTVSDLIVGTLYSGGGSSITSAEYTALANHLVLATDAGITNTLISLDRNGVVRASFSVGSSAVSTATALVLKVDAATEATYAITTTSDADKIFYKINQSVTGLMVKKYKGSGDIDAIASYSDMTSTTIEAKAGTSSDYDYLVYVGTTPANANDDEAVISVSSSDSSVVTAEYASSGTTGTLTGVYKLTGKKVGTATLTFTTGNGISKNVAVTVKATKPASFTLDGTADVGQAITTYTYSTAIPVGETLTPVAKFVEDYATDKTLTWNIVSQAPTSAGDTVISIDATTGTITGVSAGDAVVKATSNGNSNLVAQAAVTIIARSATTVTAPKFAFTNAATGAPVSTPATTTQNYALKMTLTSASANTEIYYTTDGTTVPTAASTKYTGPVTLDETTKAIKAIAVYTGTKGYANSGVTDQAAITFELKPTEITLAKTAAVSGSTEFVLAPVMSPAKVDASYAGFTWPATVAGSYTVTPAADDKTATVVFEKAGTFNLEVASDTDSSVTATCKVTVTAVNPSSISLNKTTASLPMNEELELTATVTPANAFGKNNLTWTSSNKNIATVDDGVVTPKAEGTATITVQHPTSKISANCVVTVTANATKVATPVLTVKTAGGSVDTATKFTDLTHTLYISTATADATLSVTVYKDGVKVQDAGSSGTFSLSDNGEYYVEAKATKSPSMNASDIVSATYVVAVPVIAVTIAGGGLSSTNRKLEITGAGSVDLTATNVIPVWAAETGYTWSTSNDKVAVIYGEDTGDYDADFLYGVGVGTATITATAKDGSGKKDSITVTVKDSKVSGLALATGITTAQVGETYNLNDVFVDANTVSPTTALNKKLSWMITEGGDNATLNASTGIITFAAAGTVTIKAVSTDGNLVSSAEKTITVSTASTVAKPVIAREDGNATVTDIPKAIKVAITCATSDADVYYTTDGSTPSQTNGTKYTAPFDLAEDKTVRAKAFKTGLSAVEADLVRFAFKLAVTELKLTPSKTTVDLGGEITLKVEVLPSNADDKDIQALAFSPAGSFAEGTDTITQNVHEIKLTASDVAKFGGNTVTITATADDGSEIKGTCQVTITKPTITKIEVVSEVSGSLYVGDAMNMVATITPVNVDQSVTWKSSNTSVATVSLAGKVSAVAVGEAIITATSVYDTTKSATYTVSVVADPAVIPTEPSVKPVFTVATTRTFEVSENGDGVFTLGAFDADAFEAVRYYYTVTGSVATAPATSTVSISDKGVVTLNVKNAQPNGTTYTFDNVRLTLTLTANANRVISSSIAGNIAVGQVYTVKVNKEPSSDEKAVAAAKAALANLNVSIQRANAGTEAEAKAALLAELNKALAGTGITLTADDITIADFVAATDSADGSFKYTVKLKSGDVTDTVTRSAVIAHVAPVTTKAIVVTSKTPEYRKTTSRSILALGDGTVKFDVPGYTVTKWTSSKTKVISIATDGTATLKKAGTAVKITATLSDGSKLSRVFNVQKIATEIKLQYKNAKNKWVDFSETAPMTVTVDKKFLTRAVVVAPKAGKVFKPVWTFGTTGIATRNAKNYIVGSTVGETTVTVTLYDGTTIATGTVNVVASKGIEDEGFDLNAPEDDAEIEDIVELEELEEVEVVEEIEADEVA